MYAKWTIAPSGYYIAHLQVGNKHYYASGRTSDLCEKNIKATAYAKERISQGQVWLEQSKSETLDTQYASNMFRRKYLVPKESKTMSTPKQIFATPKPIYEHTCEIDPNTQELVIYELREVARYKMKKEETKKQEPETKTEE